MQVEVWADVICPWCGLGAHRLDAALERFPHRDEVQVTRRSFQLDPGAAPGPGEPVRDMLRAKGLDDGQIDAMTRRVESLAESEGLRPYHVLDNRVGSTGLAHELLAYAADQGQQAAAWQRLFTAYFGEARPIFSVGDLVVLAGEIGLDADGARAESAVLLHRYAAQVAQEGREAAELGAERRAVLRDRAPAAAWPRARPGRSPAAPALQRAWDVRLVQGGP